MVTRNRMVKTGGIKSTKVKYEPHDAIDNPHRLAREFLVAVEGADGPPRLRFWRGEFVQWADGAYHAIPDKDLLGQLSQWIRDEFVRQNLIAQVIHAERSLEGLPPKTRHVTRRLVSDVLAALQGICLLPASVEPPAWIDGQSHPDTRNILAMRNGLLDIPARRLFTSTPAFFTFNAVPFDFDPAAPEPQEWLRFLASIWPDDPESVATLQEWFGYLLTPDTRLQKILFLVGPKRSGKGTIFRVLRDLIGDTNVCAPTLGSLATNFGLSPLLGKSVATVSDARLSGRTDTAVVVERLLSISGEDALTVDRKHRDPVTAKLSARFVLASNELPRLSDSSGALAGRLILLRMTRSFFGAEDHDLLKRLLEELPGILRWAIAGWQRLRQRGRFAQPASAAELVSDMEDLASPVGAFVRERCIVGPDYRVEAAELYHEWKRWCDEHGRREPGTGQSFGRDLRAVLPSLTIRRPKQGGERWREYFGVRLRAPSDAPDADEAGPRGSAGSATLPMRSKLINDGAEEVDTALDGIADPADPRGPSLRSQYPDQFLPD